MSRSVFWPAERPLAPPLGFGADLRVSWSGRTACSEGSSSIGRAPVSKTGGWGFESLLPCSTPFLPLGSNMAMNREQKRMLQRQGELGPDGEQARPTREAQQRRAQQARAPRERTSPRQFVREVRGELRKVAWPTREEV